MADIPSPLTFGKITGTFFAINADTDPGDDAPNIGGLEGTVTFTPSVPIVKATGTTPKYIFVKQTVVCTLIDGVLTGPDGEEGVNLLATDSPGLDPATWLWSVAFDLQSVVQQPPTFTMPLPGGTEVDLATVVPL